MFRHKRILFENLKRSSRTKVCKTHVLFKKLNKKMKEKLKLKSFLGFGLLASGASVLFFGLTTIASANSGRGPMGGPPEGAAEACESASEGDECSFEFNGETVSSTCRKSPKDDELVCMPERKEGMGQRGAGQNGAGAMRGGAQKPPTEKGGKMLSGDIELRKIREEKRLNRIVKSVEKIVAYLSAKDVDVSEIETNLDVFEEKVEAVLVAYSEYAELGTDASDEEVSAARESVKTASKEARSYFVETLKVSINEAVSELN